MTQYTEAQHNFQNIFSSLALSYFIFIAGERKYTVKEMYVILGEFL